MKMQEKLNAIRANLNRVICGKKETVESLLTVLIAGGHLLLDDVPGVGKTTLAKTLASSLSLKFHRVQFTPDLLPSDILGTSVYNLKTAEFSFREGPVFADILLADEINRASPRTQSALLEAMSERQVTCDGVLHPLPPNFMVIATENPVEFQGTYPLPEAQLDRFMMRLSLGYPGEDAELRLLEDRETGDPLAEIAPVMDSNDLRELQRTMRGIRLEASVRGYLAALVRATRIDRRIALGASPRALLMLADCARAAAVLADRDYVLPDDVRALVPSVLGHRMVLSGSGMASEEGISEVLQDIVKKTPMPI